MFGLEEERWNTCCIKMNTICIKKKKLLNLLIGANCNYFG